MASFVVAVVGLLGGRGWEVAMFFLKKIFFFFFFLSFFFFFLMENLSCQRYVLTIICACLSNEDWLED